MDAKELRERLEAAARFEVEEAGARFALRLPSEYEWRVAFERSREEGTRPVEAVATREVLRRAVVAWDGVTTGHVYPGGNGEALAFGKDELELLLDSRQDVADALMVAVARRMGENRERLEGIRKNLPPASSGT